MKPPATAQLALVPSDPPSSPRPIEHALPSGRRLTIELDSEVVSITSPDGRVELTVQCTDKGCVLHFENANLALKNSGTMDLECEQLNLHASKSLTVHSGGDLNTSVAGNATTQVAGQLSTEADDVRLRATSGDATLEANDFVKLKGEQILLNSEDDPREVRRQIEALWRALGL